MASITLSFSDTLQTRIINGICGQCGYRATLEDGSANPETKQQFAKRMIILFAKSTVIAWEANADAESARTTAARTAENEIQIS